MEQPDRSLRGSAPASSDPSPWQQRIEKKAALIRKRQARHQARQRHRITKTTLVGTPFESLDTHNVGALGRDGLNQFALLTGFQKDREELYEEITILLDTWGSTHACRFSKGICLLHFTKIVSRAGTLDVTKAELRRTIRYSKAPEIQRPRVQYGHGNWRSLKHRRSSRMHSNGSKGLFGIAMALHGFSTRSCAVTPTALSRRIHSILEACELRRLPHLGPQARGRRYTMSPLSGSIGVVICVHICGDCLQ